MDSPLVQRFDIADYISFTAMFIVCAVIGVYFGFLKGKVTTSEYLVGSRNMNVFPVALSLTASLISGITLLGTPTEVYLFGIHYLYTLIASLVTLLVFGALYLPVFHGLELNTAYEYLALRFNNEVRLLGCILFVLYNVVKMPVVVYAPALAFNQVTGANLYMIVILTCLVCIFYTCVGGVKAVIWTDVVQTFVMIAAVMFVVIKATMEVGGFQTVWSRNYETDRLEQPKFVVKITAAFHLLLADLLSFQIGPGTIIMIYLSELTSMLSDYGLDPSIRYTLWGFLFGFSTHCISLHGMNQATMQRYLCVPTLRDARRVLLMYIVGEVFFVSTCCYCGLLIFAMYHDCDPLSSGIVKAGDQLMPFLVMNTLKGVYGLPGIFIAGVFSAAFSTLSTALNSTAAVVLEDIQKPFFKRQLSENQCKIVLKVTVIGFGILCIALVFAIEKLGTVLQISVSLVGILNGPMLGVFTVGLFCPWITAVPALFGSAVGFAVISWICIGAQTVIAGGGMRAQTKPMSIDNCTHNVTYTASKYSSDAEEEIFMLYNISFIWYTFIGFLVTMLTAVVASLFTKRNDVTEMDPRLFSPVIRRFLPQRRPVSVSSDDETLTRKSSLS